MLSEGQQRAVVNMVIANSTIRLREIQQRKQRTRQERAAEPGQLCYVGTMSVSTGLIKPQISPQIQQHISISFAKPTKSVFSAWRRKVYNREPYINGHLLQVMEEACSDITCLCDLP